MKTLRVASVQFEHVNGNKEANLKTIERMVTQAAYQEVRLIAFPECCVTGYWFLRHLTRDELNLLAEPVFNGPSCKALRALAKCYHMIIGAGLLERGEDGLLYNTYVVAMPDGGFHRVRKMHAFISEHISSGSDYLVFETPYGWNVGVLICYDNNIIENTRILALMGADLLMAPHQTGGCHSLSPYGMKPIDRKLWDNRHANPEAIEKELCGPNGREWILRWLPSRAHDNGMFIVFSNGVGLDDDEVRTGNAMIFDPYGRILVETWKAGDNMIVADLDHDLLDQSTGRRWLRARRPDLYGILCKPTGRETDMRTVRFGAEVDIKCP